MKPKHKRLIIVLVSLASIFAGTFILLNNFRENLIYFYPPADITAAEQNPEKFAVMLKKQIRIGGMIKENSYRKTGDLTHEFTITDYKDEITIKYTGMLPPMFREGQGIVAQGQLEKINDTLYFNARQLITKHDEKYMPPEISRSLKTKQL